MDPDLAESDLSKSSEDPDLAGSEIMDLLHHYFRLAGDFRQSSSKFVTNSCYVV
jgi:hypothetical protein